VTEETFSPGGCRSDDPATSLAAAESINTTKLEEIVLGELSKNNGMTSFELAASTGLSLVTVSPRLRPLVRKGAVRDSGIRRTSPSGRNVIVWMTNAIQKQEAQC